MHRSYNSYEPVASKLLQKRWDNRRFDSHQKSVKTAKPMVDSGAPLTFIHLHLKLKKLQLEEERLATIERDNRILLEKMSTIMRTKGRVDNQNDVEFKSLSRERREREMLRITKENKEILKRIMNRKPESQSSVKTLQKEWNEKLKFFDNISTFPENWYIKEQKKQFSKKTVLEPINRSNDDEENKEVSENNQNTEESAEQ